MKLLDWSWKGWKLEMETIYDITLIAADLYMVHKRDIHDKNQCEMITGNFSAAKNVCKELNRKFIQYMLSVHPMDTEKKIVIDYDISFY